MATREFLLTGRDGIYQFNVKVSHIGEEFIRFLTVPDALTTELSVLVRSPRRPIAGGYLEKIIDDAKNQAREPLLWKNGFFGKRARRTVRLKDWFQAHNSPLYLNPHILDDVLKYVYLPKDVETAYRAHYRDAALSRQQLRPPAGLEGRDDSSQ
jgi:hypothetical protein